MHGATESMDESPMQPAAQLPTPLILITTVDIGEGKSDQIEVRQGDEPLDLARAFVVKHHLPSTIVEALAHHLHDNLREAAQQRRVTEQQQEQLQLQQRIRSGGGGSGKVGGRSRTHACTVLHVHA